MKSRKTVANTKNTVVGQFIKKKREDAGLTQRDVASHLKYTTAQFVSNWERGISMPPLDALPRLSKLLAVSAKDFIKVVHTHQEQQLKVSKKEVIDIFRSR